MPLHKIHCPNSCSCSFGLSEPIGLQFSLMDQVRFIMHIMGVSVYLHYCIYCMTSFFMISKLWSQSNPLVVIRYILCYSYGTFLLSFIGADLQLLRAIWHIKECNKAATKIVGSELLKCGGYKTIYIHAFWIDFCDAFKIWNRARYINRSITIMSLNDVVWWMVEHETKVT